MVERRDDPRHRHTVRISAGKAIRTIFVAVLLGSAGGCAAIDTSRSRPAYVSLRPQATETTTYRIQPGDTLNSIARDFGVSPEAILGANRLDDPDYLRVGQRIRVPRHTGRPVKRQNRPQYAGVARPGEVRMEPIPDAQPRSQTKNAGGSGQSPSRSALAAATGEPFGIETSGTGTAGGTAARPTRDFMWPVRGPVIARFGSSGSGQRNDGINIAADADTPVRAAEEGDVIYAGNELRSYGNLLLIRHSRGYVTAYAHNGELLVSKSDRVQRGQKIAKVGSTGGVAKPQLHFEIRRAGKPVDPAPYLVTETASR